MLFVYKIKMNLQIRFTLLYICIFFLVIVLSLIYKYVDLGEFFVFFLNVQFCYEINLDICSCLMRYQFAYYLCKGYCKDLFQLKILGGFDKLLVK